MPKITPAFSKKLNATANRLTNGLGLDPLTILTLITALAPLFKSCFDSDDDGDVQGKTPAEYLKSQFDESTGRFPRRLYVRARPQVRKAAKAQGIKHLTVAQCDEISHQTFLEGMNATDADLRAYFQA